MYRVAVLLVLFSLGCGRGRDTRDPEFQLLATHRGDAIQIRWEPGAAAGHMRSGELRIGDRGSRKVPLDQDSLDFGSVEFFPQTTDVRFDLDVELDDARHVVKTIQVIGGAVAAPSSRVNAPWETRDLSREDNDSPASVPDFRLPPRDIRRIVAPPSVASWHAAPGEVRTSGSGAVVATPTFPRR